LDWRATVVLFEQIRREYEFGVGTIAGVAKKLGVHPSFDQIWLHLKASLCSKMHKTRAARILKTKIS
jgi:hypothetical protein